MTRRISETGSRLRARGPAGVIVAIATVILILYAARDVQAQAGGPGRILSVNGNAFGASLIAINTDGSNKIYLKTDTSTHTPPYPTGEGRHRDYHPSQADTGLIAFESNRDQPPGGVSQTGWRIYKMNGDGTNVTQLTTDANSHALAPNQIADNFPVISPNGATIAFVSNRSDSFAPGTTSPRGIFDIFLVNTDGTNLRQVTVAQPNLAGCSGVNGSVIESVDWSPDGTRLVYRGRRVVGIQNGCPVYRRVIAFINPDGTGESFLLEVENQACGFRGSIDWSPLGNLIAYSDWDSCVTPVQIRLVGVTGGFAATLPLDGIFFEPGTVRFSPDGQQLAIARSDLTISIVTLNGTLVRSLTVPPRFGFDALWWSPGPAIPTPARFELSPDDLLIRQNERLHVSAALYDAAGNVIVRAANRWTLTPGGSAISPKVSPSGDVVGGDANQTYQLCAENGGKSDCMNIRNFNKLTVTGITPSAGFTGGGTKLRIEAFRIGAAPTVTVGGTPATGVSLLNPTTIVAIAPPRAPGAAAVAVTSGSETSTVAAGFTYVAPPSSNTTDTDTDGIPDAWEGKYSLDPRVSDAAGDPDGDGRTNLQEFQADTHPLGFFTRYLAEGASGNFFAMTIALANASTTPSAVLLRFLKSDGTVVTNLLTVNPLSRATVDPAAMLGSGDVEFSTVVEADASIIVDRTMKWSAADGYGSHAETSIASPGAIWYLAEGATHSGFDLFYLLQNSTSTDAQVNVTYLRPGLAAPLVKSYSVEANSRFNIWVDVASPELAATDVSAIVEATNGVPIIVERAMYLTTGGQAFAAGHNSAGVRAPATSWFLAEGATGAYFDLFVLIANPNSTDAAIQARFLLPDGSVITKNYSVPASSRFNIWVDLEDPALADTAVSTTVTSTNGVGIIVERTMWWPGPTGATWNEAHNSPGATETGTRWGMAEGELGGPGSTDTYILIANTSNTAGAAKVTLLFEDGSSAERTFPLNASSRFNVAVASMFAEAAGRRFGAIVESLPAGANPPAQVVVERAVYSNALGVVWAAGTNALATRLQ